MHRIKQVKIWSDRGPCDNYTILRTNPPHIRKIEIDPEFNVVTTIAQAMDSRFSLDCYNVPNSERIAIKVRFNLKLSNDLQQA